MKHLGDITKIHGWDIEPVDIIVGGTPWRGGLIQRNYGLSPSEEREFRLSSVLEKPTQLNCFLSKYLLSPKACQGILNRAERRGKQLPEKLRTALVAQSGLPLGHRLNPIEVEGTEITPQQLLSRLEAALSEIPTDEPQEKEL